MWTEELGSIVLIALIFVGAGLTYYSGEMVRMDFIFIRLPAKVQIVLTFVFDCIITLVSGLLIWPAIQFLKHFANVKTVILQISYAISYAPTLILMLMLAVCGIIRVSRTVLKIRNHTLW
jgi:TRAP-type C4-dicarboxylate transport system permease small subunit